MRINHNISAMTTSNTLFSIGREMGKSLQKLSTGLRINSASDDAAGLGVSENLRTQIRGMGQALKNTEDAISLLNIADGALNEQASIMQRMRELVIQAKNDTYTQTERDYMGKEFGQLMDELDRIAETTKYNGMQIFATPQFTGVYANGIYANNNDDNPPLTAHKTAQSKFLPNGGALGDANDGGSGHHFNMLIGQNYTANDAAAYNTTNNRDYYESSAENMLTIAFGQMDSNALFHIAPNSALVDFGMGGKGLFGDFSWNPGFGPGEDLGDFALSMADGDPTNDSVATKLDLLLKIMDGGQDIPAAAKLNTFGDFTSASKSPTGFDRINKMRSSIGAMLNRLEHSVNNLMNQMNNTQAAESLIRDTDFATEATVMTKNQILTQSTTAMLAQANTTPQMMLQLLQ